MLQRRHRVAELYDEEQDRLFAAVLGTESTDLVLLMALCVTPRRNVPVTWSDLIRILGPASDSQSVEGANHLPVMPGNQAENVGRQNGEC